MMDNSVFQKKMSLFQCYFVYLAYDLSPGENRVHANEVPL